MHPRRRRFLRSLVLLVSFGWLVFAIATATRSAPAYAQPLPSAVPRPAASMPRPSGSAAAQAAVAGRGKKAEATPDAKAEAKADAKAEAKGPAVKTKATVGIYVHHVNQVDLRANNFLADIYVWFRWTGDLDPTKTFELRNAVEQWQIVKVPVYVNAEGTAEPTTLEDGSKYQVFRIEARFGRPFYVGYYPLDEQDLLIEVEESSASSQELVYEVDGPASGVDKRIVIPGWEVASSKVTVDDAAFATNFGDPRAKPGEAYTRATMAVHIVRPTRGMIVKTIVPLAIVILITFGVFLLRPDLVEARLTLSVTALVSAIALHFSTATELPEVGYLVLLDKVYILSYVVILATTAESIAVARMAEGNEERAKRFDRFAGVLCSLLFFGGTFAILTWR